MMAGPYERQLRAAVATMRDKDVLSSDTAWTESAQNLALAAHRLRDAARAMREGFGEYSEIGREGQAAFNKAAKRARRRSRQMKRAAAAIAQANEAMAGAQRSLDDMEREPRRPGAFTPNPAHSAHQQLKAEARHGQRVRDYNTRMAEREERSRAALQDLDLTYADSSATMQRIHGEPDPPPVVRADSPASAPAVPGSPGTPTPAGVLPVPAAAASIGLPTGPVEVAASDQLTTGPDQVGAATHVGVGTDGASSPPGIRGGAVVGGLAGAGIGLLAGGGGAALRAAGGVGTTPSGTGAGTRAIGAGGRPVGAGSVLGRTGAGSGGGGATRGGTARRDTSRGATRTDRTAAGAAGSRSGVAGGATVGRRGSRDDRERSTVAAYIDSEKEWLDDEEAAPPVLD
jgi:hypothetical protein